MSYGGNEMQLNFSQQKTILVIKRWLGVEDVGLDQSMSVRSYGGFDVTTAKKDSKPLRDWEKQY